jgi:hypothetical protein
MPPLIVERPQNPGEAALELRDARVVSPGERVLGLTFTPLNPESNLL